MTGIRRHAITGDPVLLSPERASRPHAFDGEEPRATERCPFCPGNEADTPPAILTAGDPWRVRVVPNRYPIWTGAEVIVESPGHDDTFASIADADEVVGVYADRLAAHREAPYTALFRNEGRRAGATLSHVHAQVVPLPFVPPRIARETAAFTAARDCPLCSGPEGTPVGENETFRWIAPAASAFPFQQWIVPRRHTPILTELRSAEQADLARLLRASDAATRGIAPAYNWTFVSFPHPAGHFYVEVLPRITVVAGLELGTGTFVEIVDPADAAPRLRALATGRG